VPAGDPDRREPQRPGGDGSDPSSGWSAGFRAQERLSGIPGFGQVLRLVQGHDGCGGVQPRAADFPGPADGGKQGAHSAGVDDDHWKRPGDAAVRPRRAAPEK